MTKLVGHLQPPYYAVIFTSLHSSEDYDSYEKTALRMVELAAEQEGFLGIESASGDFDKPRITVSYWRDIDSIKNWRENAEHKIAQEKGRSLWYKHYRIRICLVEHEYGDRN